MRMLTLLVVTTFALTASAADYPLPNGATQAADKITRPSLEAPIRFLASDLLAGRGPATEGDRLTQIEAWEAKQYHQPSDELDATWNFDGMIEDGRLGFFAGLAIAQMKEMPGWNPGDEFEAARKKAVAEAEKK